MNLLERVVSDVLGLLIRGIIFGAFLAIAHYWGHRDFMFEVWVLILLSGIWGKRGKDKVKYGLDS